MALVTGEIWFKIPEVIEIRFVGKPGAGIGGKDVILYVLGQLKRNTVAADSVVEYTGPGLRWLSCDARFAIANMTTEFGGITGIFVSNSSTHTFISTRKSPRNKSSSIYFRPDSDATYAATHEIDLSLVKPFIAKYPNPDDVVPVTDFAGTHLDGCFIGACTTAEEDIILGALVLEQGLKMGKKPVIKTPGSRPIVKKLEETGLADVHREAGFEIGTPGCSYCVGMGADKAGEGEVRLYSQNRNFENRMGRGSLGNLASAVTVAASSFDMRATDPTHLIEKIDLERWESLRRHKASDESLFPSIAYVEPAGELDDAEHVAAAEVDEAPSTTTSSSNIVGKIQKLGDMVNTDALATAEYIIHAHSNEAIGQHCFEYINQDFRAKVKEGYNIVVAGKGFGCGSSRMEAVMTLLGYGVQCVIAESFAFIFSRNSPSLGLVTINISDPAFYELAIDGVEISVDLEANNLQVGGQPFAFSAMERQFMELGGITQAFHKHGKTMFQTMVESMGPTNVFRKPAKPTAFDGDNRKTQLAW
ncbi:aconitase iron-sulfur domain-containing protein [Setomelanomma holmii]|uniref:Aconitase iron-sulfur domain-containing protein n=1 Tax=Setomelanomma holmii TaxID=210430 RepID=A0A9P4LKX1_9PLEO|nr:aconitase iron-sulfur domain-containing protein [Setomelanomma holmii]